MATHSAILARRIPRTEELGSLARRSTGKTTDLLEKVLYWGSVRNRRRQREGLQGKWQMVVVLVAAEEK